MKVFIQSNADVVSISRHRPADLPTQVPQPLDSHLSLNTVQYKRCHIKIDILALYPLIKRNIKPCAVSLLYDSPEMLVQLYGL
jgi:hypothetical protein